jgi:hypothetical protein
MGYNFNLEQSEAELLMNALQKQTNGLLTKMQAQFAEQTKEPEQPGDEDELLVEEDNGKA